MIGFYNYTVILTYIGTAFGFMGISFVLGRDLKAALICLMIAGLCDMFDGKIASTLERTRQEKRFGIQIDSLSDLVCFGVLPALIGYQYSGKEWIHIASCVIYLLCALIRLAWFNVDEEMRQTHEEKSRERYLGLPVTVVALLLPFCIGMAQLLHHSLELLCPWLLIPIAIAFISPFHLRKPNTIGAAMMLLCGIITLALVLMGVKG